jgi:hypothetical protein
LCSISVRGRDGGDIGNILHMMDISLSKKKKGPEELSKKTLRK